VNATAAMLVVLGVLGLGCVLASPFVAIGMLVGLCFRSVRAPSAIGLAAGALVVVVTRATVGPIATLNPAGVIQVSGDLLTTMLLAAVFSVGAGLAFLVAKIVAEKRGVVEPQLRKTPGP